MTSDHVFIRSAITSDPRMRPAGLDGFSFWWGALIVTMRHGRPGFLPTDRLEEAASEMLRDIWIPRDGFPATPTGMVDWLVHCNLLMPVDDGFEFTFRGELWAAPGDPGTEDADAEPTPATDDGVA